MEKELLAIQKGINNLREEGTAVGELTDGYHSFNELYRHRIENFITVCRMVQAKLMGPMVWYSKKQGDGTAVADGWFILGIDTKAGKQITYHIPADRWDEVKKWATYRDQAPTFDGHTSADVLERLKSL